MASFAVTAYAALSQTPKVEDALSGIFGSISLTAWICLLVRLSGESPKHVSFVFELPVC